MSVFRHYAEAITGAIRAMIAAGELPNLDPIPPITVEPPRDPSHGDLATNAAMVLAKPAGRKPRDLAEALRRRLTAGAGVETIEIAGPGFLNLRLAPAVWDEELRRAIEAGKHYGDSDLGGGRPVNVEYVSANPTGPMHVGHCRGAVLGDALATVLAKVGYRVTREYYINDAGAQVDTLARSLHLRYREALGETIGEIPAGLYPGDYLVPVGRALAGRDRERWVEASETEWLPVCRRFAVDAMMALIRDDLAVLGIRHDTFTSEKEALHESGAIAEAVAELHGRDLVYEGTLEKPKGKEIEDWEPRAQTLFRAKQFGDDTDRPLKKSDGSWTYFAADIAYHRDKFRRGYATMIDVWGADHGGYIKRMKAAVAAVSEGRAELDVKICNLVKLLRAGAPAKMSKRSGDLVTVRDVVDEVGRDVVRLIMLTQKPESPMEFDFVRVTEKSKDNPVFYIQYAHARIRSVMRRVASEVPGVSTDPRDLQGANLARLGHPAERALVRLTLQWPRIVEASADAHEPHRIAYYLHELASAFHALWNQGTEAPELRFLVGEDPELTHARLAMCQGVAAVIASGLAVIGVEPVEEMR
ncbi:MAG: arginine--tRNA ligase [Alphaproteobacteria bacterium]|nr:arginine--tRNA ligase [Alphaproteobacteria bacterium]